MVSGVRICVICGEKRVRYHEGHEEDAEEFYFFGIYLAGRVLCSS